MKHYTFTNKNASPLTILWFYTPSCFPYYNWNSPSKTSERNSVACDILVHRSALYRRDPTLLFTMQRGHLAIPLLLYIPIRELRFSRRELRLSLGVPIYFIGPLEQIQGSKLWRIPLIQISSNNTGLRLYLRHQTLTRWALHFRGIRAKFRESQRHFFTL